MFVFDCFFAVAVVLAGGQTTSDAAPTKEQIAKAAQELGAPSFEARQAATDLLWQAGEAAEAALREAAKSTDPEVRTRAAALLAKLRTGIRPDTPPEVIALIEQFRYGESTTLRRQAVIELQAKGHWQAILTLLRGEQNPQERRMLATIVVGEAGKLVRPLVEKDDLPQAQAALELIASAEFGLPHYLSFLCLTGGLEKEIQAAQARLAAAPQDEGWTRLAYLLRAKGDLTAAIEAAGNTSDLFLQTNLLAEARRWNEAAALAADLFRRHPTRLETAAFAATFHRLAGNHDEHQRMIDALLKVAHIDRLKENAPAERPPDPFGAPAAANVSLGYAWAAAETLLINERLDDALPILRKINPRFAHALYWRQHQHQEALEFVNVAADGPLDRAWFDRLPASPGDAAVQHDSRVALAGAVARELRELGRKAQIDELLATLRGMATTPGDQGRRLTGVAALTLQLGRYDEAVRDTAGAIAAGSTPAAAFGALLKQQGPLATWWYEQLLRDDPLADREKTAEKALFIAAAQPPQGKLPPDWRDRVQALRAAAGKLAPMERAERLTTLGQTCQVRGDSGLAREFLGEAAEVNPLAALRAGDLALADSDWPAAAGHYAQTAAAMKDDAIAIYLHGYCLIKAGDAEAGAKQMRLATLSALAPKERLDLATGLNQRGLSEAALEQFELLRRTALPDSPQSSSAAQFVGHLAVRDRPLIAADAWDQLRLHILNVSSNFTEVEAYLSLPHLIHKARAQGAIASGDAGLATAELEACDKLLPADVHLMVERVPALHKAGMTAVADALFDRGYAILRRRCDEHSASAMYRNNTAWLCARSQRRLDEALTLANQAIELAPDEAAYRDTLAEIHFQRGDRAAAVAAAKTAVELSPDNKLFAKRLKHFESDEPKTLDGISSE